MSKKRVNEQATSYDAEESQPKRLKLSKIGESPNARDYVRDSEADPEHTISQRFLALTRKNFTAKSDEILGEFNNVLEARKKELLISFENEANTVQPFNVLSKANENELRRLAASLLLELSPIPKSVSGARPKRQSSAFAFSNDLHHNKISTLAASKAFVKDYRRTCQEIAVAREQLPAEPHRDSSEQLQLLLEKQGRRLSGEIHAILDGEQAPSTDQYDAPAEKELWTCFGAANLGENGRPSEWEKSESWYKTTKISKKALRRLVQCLPEEDS